MPNYNKLIPSLLEHGLEALPRYCHLTPGKFDQITTSYAAWMHIKKKRGWCSAVPVSGGPMIDYNRKIQATRQSPDYAFFIIDCRWNIKIYWG